MALIVTLATGMGLALLFGFVALKLRMPALVGYLVAGVLIGPATPGFVADVDLARQLAEIGVILLMFGVGLHFSPTELMAVRRLAVRGALTQMALAVGLGYLVGSLWGWEPGAALVFGLALSVASTVVLLRSLEERGVLHTINGHVALGWLVVQDLAMVLVLVLLPAFAPFLGGASPEAVHGVAVSSGVIGALGATLGKVALFVSLMLVVGRRVFPWLLAQVARAGSRELFTLCTIAVALVIALGSAELFGVSFALGAFLAGMVLGESPLSARAARESLPLRDAFAVLFFVSVGMLFDPSVLVREPAAVLGAVGVIMLASPLAAFGLVLAHRYPLNTALTLAAGLAQIGEFSFILAGLGVSLGLLPREGQNLILAGALISIALNPLLFRAVEPAQAWIRRRSRLARRLERPDDPLAELPMSVDARLLTDHVLLVGYGRVGKRIVEALRGAGQKLVVVEQDRERVEVLRERGLAAVSGDAAEPAVLIQGHVARARMLVIATPQLYGVRRMMETARMLNPDIEIMVRTHSDEEGELLRKEGVVTVFMGEHELARGMIEHILARAPTDG